jgi:hypothetical protein
VKDTSTHEGLRGEDVNTATYLEDLRQRGGVNAAAGRPRHGGGTKRPHAEKRLGRAG